MLIRVDDVGTQSCYLKHVFQEDRGARFGNMGLYGLSCSCAEVKKTIQSLQQNTTKRKYQIGIHLNELTGTSTLSEKRYGRIGKDKSSVKQSKKAIQGSFHLW